MTLSVHTSHSEVPNIFSDVFISKMQASGLFDFCKNQEDKIQDIFNGIKPDIVHFLSKIEENCSLDNYNRHELTKAYFIAAVAHRGHTRRNKITPYIQHPARLAIISSFVNRKKNSRHISQTPDDLIRNFTLLLLHDTIEDTQVSQRLIHTLFDDSMGVDVMQLSSKGYLDTKEEERLSRYPLGSQQYEDAKDHIYYQGITSKREEKIIDRIESFATMENMSDEKIIAKIEQTKKHILSGWNSHNTLRIALIMMINRIISVRSLTNYKPLKISDYIQNTNSEEVDEASKILDFIWNISGEVLAKHSIRQKGEVEEVYQEDYGYTKFTFLEKQRKISSNRVQNTLSQRQA